jgi:hypothetical protein
MKIEGKVQKRLADSLAFVEKRGNLSASMKLADSDLHSFEERGIEAGIITNFQKRVMDSEEGREFIKSNNYGPYLPELLPVIIAWYPNFPLKDLISVQDMEQDLAYIITSELLTGTNKGGTTAGQKVETPNGLREIKGSYPSGEVLGEIITEDALQVEDGKTLAALVYFPLLSTDEAQEITKLTVQGSAGTADYIVKSVTGKVIHLEDAGGNGADIELATGILEVADSTVVGDIESIDASYMWNIEYAKGDTLPTVVEDMKMEPMIARPRVLAMKWTIFSELVKKKQFSQDIRTDNTNRVLDLLYQYLVRYILDRMYRYATGGTELIKGINTSIIDPNFKAQEILRQLNLVSQKIANNTGRVEGNRLVVGARMKNYLEALDEKWYKPEREEDYGFQGPRKIGQFGRFMVFYDNELAEDEGWMTYRGSKWYDAAFYLGVFMPIAPTDAININIDVEQAFVDMNAYKFDKPQAVIKLKFDQYV